MPPALPFDAGQGSDADQASDADQGSDAESIGGEIPSKAMEESKAAGAQVNGELQDKAGRQSDAEDEDEESQAEDDVYEVEAIRSHSFYKGKLLMSVKWKGYPDNENTEESEEMLQEGASEILKQYYESVGGRPQPAPKIGKRKSSSQLKATSDTPATKKSRRFTTSREESVGDSGDKTGSWVPKKQDWESEVASIDTVERDPDTGKLWALIYFTNERRSRVGMELVHRHCPLAMLKFYESHLKINQRGGSSSG